MSLASHPQQDTTDPTAVNMPYAQRSAVPAIFGLQPRDYACRVCDRRTKVWVPRCPGCGREGQYTIQKNYTDKLTEKIIGLGDPNIKATERFDSGSEAFNRVLGGGIPKSAVILFGGSEGGGKSTLSTEILCRARCRKKLLCTGEETVTAVNERTRRLELDPDPATTKMLYTTDSDEVFLSILQVQPDLVVVDSSQAFTTSNNRLRGAPGSSSQIKYLTMGLVKLAKKHNISIIIISQVNQDGTIAGPQKQKHWVDVVLWLRRNEKTGYRVLMALKSRVCATHVKIPLVMTEKGLKLREEVSESKIEKPRTDENGPAPAYTPPVSTQINPSVPKSLLPPRTFTGRGILKLVPPPAPEAPKSAENAVQSEQTVESKPRPSLKLVDAIEPAKLAHAKPKDLKEVAEILAQVQRDEEEEEKRERKAKLEAAKAEKVEVNPKPARAPKTTKKPSGGSKKPEPTGPMPSSWLSGSDEDDLDDL